MKFSGMTLMGLVMLAVGLSACGGESAPEPADSETMVAAPAQDPMTDAATNAPAAGALLDPNEATRDQLLALPGMTPAAADAIVAGRPYQDNLALDQALAAHLGETERETVYRSVWLPIDLNEASAEEILLIPGVGDRMLHEFEEYRPYQAIEQFRREMAKYVDDEEVARLERYVEIR